jgi:hypothetical protein
MCLFLSSVRYIPSPNRMQYVENDWQVIGMFVDRENDI